MNRYERLNQERKIVDAKKRAAAYCRVSTDNEDQSNSFESQQRYFRQYIELRLAIMSSIAQEESRKTSERVKWGQKRPME